MVDPVQPPPPALPRQGAANSNYPASSALAAVAASVMGQRPNTVRPLPRVRTLFRDRLVEDARDGDEDGDGSRVTAAQLAAAIAPWTTPQMISAALAFLAQQISQEVMATGLYFEPWNQVIAAYQRRLARIEKRGGEHRLDVDG
jgi:hypothetical protein